ncbi:broad specificity phosphatase PhoE [Arthrobacter bambusae]|uniref:phosphoglycerate mutase (2,3-diphosphoglycerate-dependent) n=2 Tax=Arthrobacter TaxID=1663 RepID=A0AAW8DI10_9MICC|nr:broad specificity phosphatase PhoE [Arthrobacter bambusae]MDQ0129089.1 broad specificity phosphatase PhoE [Arthrobacter bambusae]MDQ0180565.1 broad specificity phosphatase PhoE [Arthrobacter bambusae]
MSESMRAPSGHGAVELMLVRHGESLGNVAASAAGVSGAEVIEVPARDADVDLSPLGYEQASALGDSFNRLPSSRCPDVVWCSPYARARRTAEIIVGTAGWTVPLLVDERLRDRELGILDMLTTKGVELRLPEEARRRRWLGKFYYRPPGGESWTDVVLRLRSFLSDLERLSGGERVLVVGHDAVILLFRYLLEGLSEKELLDLAGTTTILNASLTRYVRVDGHGPWMLESFNVADHLTEQGVTLTEHGSDADVRPR